MTEIPLPIPAVPTPESVRKALRAVKDPELNLNIIDIGLVYDIEVSEPGDGARSHDADRRPAARRVRRSSRT